MFPEPTELLSIGCSIESIWIPTIQIKYIDTQNQPADMLTKGNFTRDEWNHLLCLFNISHFSSTNCSEVMSKRTQKMQVKKESQQSQDQWWIWSRGAAKGILTCLPLLLQKARGKPDTKVKLFWVRKLRSTIERGNPLFAVNEEQGHSNSSLETTKQNWICR